MKKNKLRTIIPLAVILIIAVGYVINTGIGTISAFGWQDIALLCPMGALSTMLASKTLVPKALISLVLAVIGILLLGRAFCAWVCPVPLVSRLRNIFKKAPTAESDSAKTAPAGTADIAKPLTASELASLKGCSSSMRKHESDITAKVDSRHFILGGALLSAAIFGFPVFCLICPIGLTFATILLVYLLFAQGSVTWSVIVVPVLLLIEVVFFRKWCSKICPLSALMSLIAKGNKTFRPVVDENKCIHCERCATVCDQGINLLDPSVSAPLSECTKCRACVENCPTGALSMPFIHRSEKPVANDTPELTN